MNVVAGILVLIAACATCAAAAPVPLRTSDHGGLDLIGADGKPLLRNFTWSVRVDGDDVLGPSDRFAAVAHSADGGFTFDDLRRQLKLVLNVKSLQGRSGAVLELILTNISSADLKIPQIELIRATAAEHGSCDFAADRVLTNGYIYYDSGQLRDFKSPDAKPIDSFWNATFYAARTRRALVVGYLNNDAAEGHIVAQRTGNGLDMVARSLLHPSFVLKAGASISAGRVLLLDSNDPLDALEFYGDSIVTANGAVKRNLNPVINGWCSWFVYYGGVSEAEVLKNAAFIAKELKPYGMDWIQIDDGFYRAFGDWEGNDRFPAGMKHTADEIKKLGLKPGLWIAPYCIGEKTEIATKHPDWLVHEPDGSLQKIEAAHQNQAQYILDITNPDAKQWLGDLLKTITQDWGYRFIKTDFVEWTLLAAQQFRDRTITTAQAYRLGDQVMRDAMGTDAHFLDCGPGNEAVGLIDSMRIGLDRPDDLPNFGLWQQYALSYNATIPSVAKRYYFGGRTWHNDPDHLRTAKLTIPQAQAASTIIALSGGTTISGDKLYELDRERIEIIKKVLPSYGKAARPLDLFENPQAEQFALPIRTSWGDWTVVAHFNPRDKHVAGRFAFAYAGLDPAKTYLVYDFWRQTLLGEFTGDYPVAIDPTAVRLVSIREKTGRPQVISTDRHVTQGAIELENVKFDDTTSTLSGTALGAAPMTWTLSAYVPAGYRLDESAAAVNLTDIKLDGSVLRARVTFEGSAKTLEWSLKFLKS